MSTIQANAILDASGGNTTTVNGVTPTANNVKGRNLIINGAMQVWQRGTSLGTNFGYLNDRFKGSATDSGVSNYTMVATRIQDSPIGLKGYCSELSLGTGATGINYATYGQRIEASSFHGVNSGDQMTFSFYVKKMQSADSNFIIYVKSAQSGVDSYQASALISQYETSVASSSLGTFNSLSTSWERKTFTFTVTDALITNGGQIFLEMGPANLNVSNTNGLYRTTGWQLEVGSVATEFDHRSYGEELSLCQRYYEKSAGVYYTSGMTGDTTTGEIYSSVNFKVTKRTTPTVTIYDTAGNSNKLNRINIGVINNNNQTNNSGGFHADGIAYVASNSGAAANALVFQYQADAEL